MSKESLRFLVSATVLATVALAFACDQSSQQAGAGKKKSAQAVPAAPSSPLSTPTDGKSGKDANDDGGTEGDDAKDGKDEDGKDGKDGKDEDGKDGKDGKDEDGKDGKDGKDGIDVDDGNIKPDQIEFDEGKVTGVKGSQASINFEDIAGGDSDRDYNDGNLCMDGAVEPIFKVDTAAKTIRILRDASIVAKLHSASGNQNSLKIILTHLDGKKTELGPFDPRVQQTTSLTLKRGDDLKVQLHINGTPAYMSTDPAQAEVTVGFCKNYADANNDDD